MVANDGREISIMMPKTRPLYAGAESNLGDRVLGEVEKNRFIALPGKGDKVDSCPEKLCVLTRGVL